MSTDLRFVNPNRSLKEWQARAGETIWHALYEKQGVLVGVSQPRGGRRSGPQTLQLQVRDEIGTDEWPASLARTGDEHAQLLAERASVARDIVREHVRENVSSNVPGFYVGCTEEPELHFIPTSEHWLVSPWLAGQLGLFGQHLTKTGDDYVWHRPTRGDLVTDPHIRSVARKKIRYGI